MNSLEKLIELNGELAKADIKLNHLIILLSLPESQSKLAALTSVSTAAMTGTADALGKKGLAERKWAPDDRRKIMLTLTEKGKELLDRIDAVFPLTEEQSLSTEVYVPGDAPDALHGETDIRSEQGD